MGYDRALHIKIVKWWIPQNNLFGLQVPMKNKIAYWFVKHKKLNNCRITVYTFRNITTRYEFTIFNWIPSWCNIYFIWSYSFSYVFSAMFFLVMKHAKKHLPVRPKTPTKRKKRRNWKGYCKAFCVTQNAIMQNLSFSFRNLVILV